ncbi:MAG: DUF2723 domain-containing protein [Holophagales bacterium]|nr:DUF2723 domain-containing protein [Holophagales bacterium]
MIELRPRPGLGPRSTAGPGRAGFPEPPTPHSQEPAAESGGSRRAAPVPARAEWVGAGLAGALPATVYVGTMARGLVWGDGPELIAVAASLGVAHPTGYPLFTLLGHLASRLPWGTPAFLVTLLCAILMASACVALYLVLLRTSRDPDRLPATGLSYPARALAGTLCFAWAAAPWSHGTRVEVYGLQILFQTTAAAALLSYLRAPSPGRLALVAWLVASALGHHLLGAVLAPGLLVAFARAAPAARKTGSGQLPRWLRCGTACFLLGLLPVLYVPLRAGMSAAGATGPGGSPSLVFDDPSTPERWLWMLTGGDYPGAYLMGAGKVAAADTATDPPRLLELLAQRAVSLGRFVAGQVVPRSENTASWPAVTLGVSALLMLGWRHLARARPVFAHAWTSTSGLYLFVVLVYGIRDISDYHLGLWAWMWPVVWHGLWTTATSTAAAADGGSLRLCLAFAMPTFLLLANWTDQNRTHHRVPDRYADALLEGLPPGALVVTEGDAATATAWYLQHADPRRPAIEVVCVNLLGSDGYARQLERRGLWHGPLPSVLGSARSDRTQLLWHGVLAPHAGRRPIALVVSRSRLEALGVHARLGPRRELLTSSDVVEVMASGEDLPAQVRVELLAPHRRPAPLRGSTRRMIERRSQR